MRLCEECGKEFSPRAVGGRPHRFCTSKCRNRHKARAYRQEHSAELKLKRKEARKAAEQARDAVICQHCGKSFLPIRNNNVFCSSTCGEEFRKQKKKKGSICRGCGSHFFPTWHTVRFCDDCKKRLRDENTKATDSYRVFDSLMTSCRNCEGKFSPRHKANVFCSRFCAQEHRRNNKIQEFASRESTAVCPNCGDRFEKTYSWQKFCTGQCRDKFDRSQPEFRDRRLWTYYKLRLPDVQDRLLAQGNQCPICERSFDGSSKASSWVVDHDHSCCPAQPTCGECNRGIICGGCNTALGLASDSVDVMAASIAYLNSGRRIERSESEASSCEVCGTSFFRYRATSKYCSKACQGLAARARKKMGVQASFLQLSCPFCGKAFVQKHTDQKFCSRECLSADWRDFSHYSQTLTNYGLSREVFEAELTGQNARCRICQIQFSGGGKQGPHIDHDHECCPKIPTCGTCNRGIICGNCNGVLGMMADDVRTMESAVTYLQSSFRLVSPQN